MLRPPEGLFWPRYGVAASRCVPEMVNSGVVSRRANALFTPAGLLENAARSGSHENEASKDAISDRPAAMV